MSEKPNGGQAFPVPAGCWSAEGDEWNPVPGMSLRDYFATRFAAHFISAGFSADTTPMVVASKAYRFADAMLAEREK